MLKIKKEKILLAVSGGPDSMFMLNKFKKYNVVVAHINYNKRIDSNKDQIIVEQYCKKYQIPFFTLNVNKQNYPLTGNFQDIARKIRYDFFKQIYQQENCSVLFIAHNKDDFIESAIMQKKQNKIVNYWGIKTNNKIFSMNIKRPLINKLWKKQIENKLKKKQIEYAIDSSNNQNIYQRNKIRLELKNKYLFKFFLFYKYKMFNFFLHLKNLKKNWVYKRWKNKNYDASFLLKKQNNFHYLIYKMINENYYNINLTKGKIESIFNFIISKNRTSSYKIKDNIFLLKIKNKLVFKSAENSFNNKKQNNAI
ncbi:tRNA lysidine(34) synthetase TilS [Mesomycoplasma lagogenitalium]|uniref:tRNA(Ile)-lysidine synthase n=1 Tax=Mesomycoplasma lagogenitalium TaxID=171286 RepID=A0ABY8LTQ1_9BACT|nr:tRNA lysidine(34) synthetase TilS [Mesomycoplasma lagogenitalium]WGI36622.1 tRNA lysidine(34) synthetase TilS [Mesomycoplasma lagogenitalium]